MSMKGCGRRVRDEAEARACLDAVGASGLSPREWARNNGFDGRSLQAWRLNLARRASASTLRRTAPPKLAPRLVELLPRPAAVAPVYVIQVGELRVEVRADFDVDVLRRLVHAVAAC